MKFTKQKAALTAATIVMLVFIVIMGPMDIFTHGYYCDVIDYEEIPEEEFKGFIKLEEQDFTMDFAPVEDHFAGFEINLINQPGDNKGALFLTIYDDAGEKVDEIEADLSKIIAGEWYSLYANHSLRKNHVYTLTISAVDCETVPYLQIVNPDYLTEENISDDLLIGYAYAKSTFTFQDKILISLFVISAWGFLFSLPLRKKTVSKVIRGIAIFIFLISVLAWNYMYNSMDNLNRGFSNFQEDSETLVTGPIMAEHNGVWFSEEQEGFGLGRYLDVSGNWEYYDVSFNTDDEWSEGYSRNVPAILVNSNSYTREMAQPGNYIQFGNNDILQIADVNDDETNIIIYLDSDKILTSAKYGSLSDIAFYNADFVPLRKGNLTAYRSQYGLQGKVFRHIARYMDYNKYIINLNLICSLGTAFVFVLIVFLLVQKYDILLAGIFYITFWLSPWIVNFARNLYWVEFTWFLPMAAGLFCAWKINNRECRLFSYIVTFIAIVGKCLCGYEYISTIMLGLIAFPLTDFVLAILSKNTEKQKLLLRTIFILGLAAIAGFVTAICIHAPLRGDGSITEGMRNIFEQDVLRRTTGGDVNNFSESYRMSFDASVWEVVCKYFKFDTEVITGITGNLFPILCMVPSGIFIYECKQKKLNIELLAMYVIFFLVSVSWFCLAKAHSYVHTHMNYVLWYFGFVQVCFYVIVNKIREGFSGVRKGRNQV